MSSQTDEPPHPKKSSCSYDINASVEVVGNVQGTAHVGARGVITQVETLVFVTLDNGVHVRGPFTSFRLIK